MMHIISRPVITRPRCGNCNGAGSFVKYNHQYGYISREPCPVCNVKRFKPEEYREITEKK